MSVRGAGVTVSLPGGYWRNGEHRRRVRLHPVEDEAFLRRAGPGSLPAERVTGLLADCLEEDETPGLEPLALARLLSVGDREALLLHLRRLSVGEQIESVLSCPAPGCGATVELELAVTDLLLPPYSAPEPRYARTISHAGAVYHCILRLPTGADQEAAARVARSGLEAAAGLLLRRCLLEARTTGEAVEPDSLPVAVVDAVAAELAALDPQAELLLEVACPACGRDFPVLFDTAVFLLHELGVRAQRVYREVHSLALHYHWSEAEILGMPGWKRRMYLDLIAEVPAGEWTL